MTPQRRLILEALRQSTAHPTADELYTRVREQMPRISLGTVYRNLDLLVRTGLARKLAADGGQARYDADMREHYHVRCSGCGRIGDVQHAEMPRLDAYCAHAQGFEISGCRIEFEGLCPRCQVGRQ